jgi:hypothetical protein
MRVYVYISISHLLHILLAAKFEAPDCGSHLCIYVYMCVCMRVYVFIPISHLLHILLAAKFEAPDCGSHLCIYVYISVCVCMVCACKCVLYPVISHLWSPPRSGV